MTEPQPLTFGDIEDATVPLAVLVHGFPDTPHTWRHLGPDLAARGYRVVAPWLPGYDAPTNKPISVGTYVRSVLDVRGTYRADDRAVLIGHDWGAVAAYGAVATEPGRHSVASSPWPLRRPVRWRRCSATASSSGRSTSGSSSRSGLPETVLLEPGFWESLWADWSPGYDPHEDVAELRRHVNADNIANVIAPYRASFNPDFADPNATAEALATLQDPPVPTLYLHGADDGALGVDVLRRSADHLPAAGSTFEIIDGVGHFLHLERPEVISARILDWLG